jgi:hypothetical protein
MKFSLKNVNSSSVLANRKESVITISGVIEKKMCLRGSLCRSLWRGNCAIKVQYAALIRFVLVIVYAMVIPL